MTEPIKSINGRTVAEIVASHACVHVDEVKPETNFHRDFALDSLDSIELCMKIEKEFNIAIADEYWETACTVEDIEKLIKTLQ